MGRVRLPSGVGVGRFSVMDRFHAEGWVRLGSESTWVRANQSRNKNINNQKSMRLSCGMTHGVKRSSSGGCSASRVGLQSSACWAIEPAFLELSRWKAQEKAASGNGRADDLRSERSRLSQFMRGLRTPIAPRGSRGRLPHLCNASVNRNKLGCMAWWPDCCAGCHFMQ